MFALLNRWRLPGVVLGALLLGGLGFWATAAPAPRLAPAPQPEPTPTPPASGLVVHEWGTFLSVQGSDGKTLGGMVDSEERLPSFVRERDLFGRNRACLMMKMETPVTYFYIDRPMTAEIRVGMPGGLLTHWFPAVQSFGPSPDPKVKPTGPGSFLDWGKVELFPDTPEFVGVGKPVPGVRSANASEDTTWRFARETDSALVKVSKAPVPVHWGGEVEKFLFYRGLGEFDLPLSVSSEGNKEAVLTLRNRGSAPLTSVFAIRVRQGQVQYARLPDLAAESEQVLDTARGLSGWMVPEDGIRQVKQQLTTALAKEGLFGREALAMTNTWERSYFHNEGLRILYVLPRPLVDEVIPIQIRPAPDRLERVMVGRVEVLTPAQEQNLLKQVSNLKAKEKAVRDSAAAQIEALGRLKEPTLRRLLTLSNNREQREQIEGLIKAAVKPAPKS